MFQMVLKTVTWYDLVLLYISQTVAGAYTDVISEALFSPRRHVPNCVYDKYHHTIQLMGHTLFGCLL